MKYFIITFVVIMFVYFVVKYKLFPSIRRKAGKPEASGVPAVSGIPAEVHGITFRHYPRESGGFTCFEVLAFSRDVEESDSAFAERISLHLARAAAELNGKGCAFATTYATLSDTLVVLLSWRI